jgi:cellulose synthase/poly-beta-1,6-N-acetylglucosamine synthase-like glycosyltransferase
VLAMKKVPRVAVILPAYREDPALFEDALRAVSAQTYRSFVFYIILDSACSEEVRNTAQKFAKSRKNVKVIQDKKRGSAAHRNLGTRKAGSVDYFAFIDSDCIAKKDWLENLVSEMDVQPPSIGCVGGLNLSKERSLMPRAIARAESSFMGGGSISGQTSTRRKKRFVNSLPNCNALYRRECWSENQQDESFIKGQDAEFNLRLSEQGWKFLQIPSAVVYHKRDDSLSSYSKRMREYGSAVVDIIRKQGLQGLRRFWYSAGVSTFYVLLFALLVYSSLSPPVFGIFLNLALAYLALLSFSALLTVRWGSFLPCLLAVPVLVIQHASYSIGFVRRLLGL